MKVAVNESIATIRADDWNALTDGRFPFLSHEFLLAAEQSGSVSADTGWAPQHITLTDNGKLSAAMLLYKKSHSWGEFVFDWSWADAYQRAAQ